MIGFSQGQGGPGGAGVLSFGAVGAGSVSPGEMLNQSQGVAAPGDKPGAKIPPVLWMFVFLIVGYWGIHMSLKAV